MSFAQAGKSDRKKCASSHEKISIRKIRVFLSHNQYQIGRQLFSMWDLPKILISSLLHYMCIVQKLLNSKLLRLRPLPCPPGGS